MDLISRNVLMEGLAKHTQKPVFFQTSIQAMHTYSFLSISELNVMDENKFEIHVTAFAVEKEEAQELAEQAWCWFKKGESGFNIIELGQMQNTIELIDGEYRQLFEWQVILQKKGDANGTNR